MFGLVVWRGGVGVVGGGAVVVHLVAVGVENLVELLVVGLDVEGDVVGQVVFETDDGMCGLLHAGGDVLAAEGGGHVEVGRACEEAVEEVDNVVVRTGVEEDLAVESAGEFQTQVLAEVVFCCQSGLDVGAAEGGVIHQSHAGVENPFAQAEIVGGEEG